jgi:hypothetical protein
MGRIVNLIVLIASIAALGALDRLPPVPANGSVVIRPWGLKHSDSISMSERFFSDVRLARVARG